MLADRTPLAAQDAVAAIILVGGERYLLQHRDDKPGIWYPDHWGCFGGGLDPGETPEDALRRELSEELGLDGIVCTRLPAIAFQLPRTGERLIYRYYFEVRLSGVRAEGLSLGEGCEKGAFDIDAMFTRLLLVPYDAFALFLHARGDRVRLAGRA